MVQKVNNKAFNQYWVLDAQWTDCPEEVEEQVESLWRYFELGNENFMWRGTLNSLISLLNEGAEVDTWVWGETDEEKKGWVKKPIKLDKLIDYAREQGREDDETFIIHWWW
mgnify:CR=1 FL=1|jgi:hypothetical protein